jgi:hypothetical protein
MRLNNAIRVGAVGTLDCIHVTTDWATTALQACGPVWAQAYAPSLAAGVLVIATWCVAPHAFLWLISLLKALIMVHSVTTYAFFRIAFVTVRNIVILFWMLEVYLAARLVEKPDSQVEERGVTKRPS